MRGLTQMGETWGDLSGAIGIGIEIGIEIEQQGSIAIAIPIPTYVRETKQLTSAAGVGCILCTRCVERNLQEGRPSLKKSEFPRNGVTHSRGEEKMGKAIYSILFTTLLALFGCEGEKAETAADRLEDRTMKTIVAVGDSLTAGQGLAEEEAYPALLEKKLQADGYQYKVINAGVSAETSSGTLSRLEWVLSLDPDIVILETGANDGLRGIDPQVLEKNLREILATLKERDVAVVLAGMRMVHNLGPAYVSRFNAVYPKLAEEFEPVFFPFFLQDVAMQGRLNQADVIHPNAEGYRKITENIYPYVLEAIRMAEVRGQRTEAR